MVVEEIVNFQIAILEPTSSTTATVLAVTNIVTSITAGLFTLPLTAPLTIVDDSTYYLAVYNQVNASLLAGETAGLGTVLNAPPVNFRIQNIAGFTVGQNISTSDVSLSISPCMRAH